MGSAKKIVARVASLILIAGGLVVVSAGSALAACHAFTVSVSPSSVTEGGKVTVTVARDGAVAPSSIMLSTVDQTAKVGKDYDAFSMRVEFTDDTERTFKVSTINDSVHESKEAFKLHLSDPQGCTPGVTFSVGPDALVTIVDNDAAPATSPRASASSTPKPTATAAAEPKTRHASGVPTTSAKPSPRASTKRSPSSSPHATPNTVVAAAREEKATSSGGTIVIIVLVASALFVSGAVGIVRLRAHNR
jgi:hypothetical protein